jgi:cell division inhibitor SepF
MRVYDTGAARRPDDSGLQVRPVGTPRQAATAQTVRPIAAGGETVTVRPRSFNQAQEIADYFKEGLPVIVNLEGLDGEMPRRIIDFASGMCYALGGTIEKVGTGVFLLKPAVSFDSPRY